MDKLRSRSATSVALALGLWLLAAPAASAYIDGGSASMAFQVLIGVVMAAGVTLRMFWGRVRSLFTGRGADAEPAVPAERIDADRS